ncbi:MAG: TonB-dependent receptor [Pseudomonadota bacterium]
MIKFTTAASVFVFVAAGAFAQGVEDGQVEEEARQDVIIVQGTKFEQSLMETPDSVSVVTAQEIEREPIADLYDIVERIPNVTAAFGEQGFSIRGVDQRGIGGGGSGLTITTYVDDAPLGNQTTFFGPTGSWDVEQIEVFRGPQSTNFGRNALAGAIYIRTRDPEFEPDLRLRAEIAEADTYQISAAGGTALIEDTLAFRLSGDYRESAGFIDNTFLGEDADAAELSNIRGKLLFTPTENLRIVTTTTYAENFAGEDLVPIDADDSFVREVQYNRAGREGTETFLNAVNVTWDINDLWQLQSITTHQSTDYVRIEDFDASPVDEGFLDRTGTDEALSQELRLKYTGDRLDALAGLYYVDTENSFSDEFVIDASALNPLLAGLLIGRDSVFENTAENFALFFDGEYQVNDKLSLLFGARYDWEEATETGDATTAFIPGIPPGLPPQITAFLQSVEGTELSFTEGDFEAFLPKLGIQYAIADHTNLAFVVQQGYRSGGSELDIVDGSVNDFDPEFLTNYEFSTRSTLLDGDLRINTNWFYGDWQDQQVPVPIDPLTPTLTRTENAGKSSLMGVEAEVDYSVSPSLDVYGSFGYTKAEFEDFQFPDPDTGVPVIFDGNTFPFAPEFSLNAGFAKFLDNGIYYGLDVNYRDEVFTTNENQSFNVVDAYTIVNARIGYEINDYSRVTVYARNLFDEDYLTQVNRPFEGANGVDGVNGRLGDPRVVGVRLEANF